MQKYKAARMPHLWGQMQTNQYRITRASASAAVFHRGAEAEESSRC
jgi:hypothetical protein